MTESFYSVVIAALFAAAVILGTKHFNPQQIDRGTKALITKEAP
jgi:hypothetical protein